MKTAVVAIGGNAILRSGEEATLSNQIKNLRQTCSYLAKMIKSGYDIVITHGNGPQVGDILLQNEIARNEVPAMPLDVCVAESQGEIGYMISQALTEELRKIGVEKVVTCIITRALVDRNDPALKTPTKPIGPYYSEEDAEDLKKKGWTMREDRKRGGYRRLVPSPRPIDIIEVTALKRMIFGGEGQAEIVVASGGGGVPVARMDGELVGLEAVVDKDLAAAVLACAIQEKLLILLTDVDQVYLDFNSKEPKPLSRVTLNEIIRYNEQGQFPPGSMGPKIDAAIQFLRCGGEEVVITSHDKLENALEGSAGTHIVKV